tara:strand:- start:5219 stop:6220 length:1002 start_codon:yes stop_codon:yes gene_type:complete
MNNKILINNRILIKRNLPKNHEPQDSFLFSREIERELPHLHSFSHKNICINANQYLWKNLFFLEETFFRREKRKKEKLPNFKFLIKSLFKKKRIINEGLWLIDNWSHGYFHWFGDVLQKYYALKKEGSKLILPYSYSKIDFIITSSKILNIELEFIHQDEILKCNNLIIVPTTFISGNFYDNLMMTIQSKFSNLITSKKPTSKILYLSRELTNRRKVKNDNEIRYFVKLNGGKTLILEETSWIDQLAYFKNCEFLISPHGASLTNMIFCSNNVKIIEFRHHNSKIQNMYFSLSSSLKVDYFYIKCQGDNEDSHVSDIEVPVKKLQLLFNTFDD